MTTGDSYNGSDSQRRLSDQISANTHKNTTQLHALFALANLVIVKQALLAPSSA
jgi:hypothetical protein